VRPIIAVATSVVFAEGLAERTSAAVYSRDTEVPGEERI